LAVRLASAALQTFFCQQSVAGPLLLWVGLLGPSDRSAARLFHANEQTFKALM
jgi:hypothetical protein